MIYHMLSGLLLCLPGLLSSCQFEPTLDESLLASAEEAFNRREYALAEPLFTQIIQESQTKSGLDQTRAWALYHLGELYRLQGKPDKAEPYFWKALPLWAKTVGPTHSEMAKGLTSLGYVYEARQEFQKAEPLIKQALKVRESAFGRDHPNIVPNLEQYAGLLKLMNRQDEALSLLDRRKAILRKSTFPEQSNGQK